MRRFISFAVLAAGAYAERNCSAEPVAIPIKDYQVLPDVKDSYMRGVSVKIGSPAQDFVVLPWAELNNTWIYDDQAYCDKTVIWNDMICRVRRGNLLSEEDSKTYKRAKNVIAAGGTSEQPGYVGAEAGIPKLVSSGAAGDDSFQVAGTKALSNFPIGTPRLNWDHGYTILNPLGLGSNSTYLNAMRDAGQLASRVWSIFWGRMWVDEPYDGSLVLGGYDADKVLGDNYTAPLVFDDADSPNGCWTGMKLTVSDITINFRDGSDKSIMPGNTALPICLVPQRHLLIEMPSTYVGKFEEETNMKSIGDSFGLHWSTRSYDAKDAFDGDLTIKLSSGLEVRVPNDQFVVPYVDIDRNGSRIFNESRRDLLMGALGDQPAMLGRYFLTAAYLMVNHDAGTFTLWQANPTRSSNLVKVVSEDSAKECKNDADVIQKTPDGSEKGGKDEDKGKDDSSESSGTPIGAIVGGVVGGVIGLLAIIAIIFFCWRRRRAQRDQEYRAAAQAEHEHEHKAAAAVPAYASPMASPMPTPMPTPSPAPYEVGPAAGAGAGYYVPAKSPQELAYVAPHEMGGGDVRPTLEMPATSVVYEMSGESRMSELSGHGHGH